MANKGQLLLSNGVDLFSSHDYGRVVAGAISAVKKLFIFNNTTREVDISGTITQFASGKTLHNYSKWAWGTSTLSSPPNFVATLLTGGSLDADTTYYYKIIAINATGSTGGNTEVTATTTSVYKSTRLTWDAVTGATGYKIFRSEVSGSYADSLIEEIVSGSTTSYVDNTATPDSTNEDLPTENTTAGAGPAYGSAPALGTGTLTATLQPGELKAFWLRVDPSVIADDDNNPELAVIEFTEV